MFARQYIKIGVNSLSISSLVLNIIALVFVIASPSVPSPERRAVDLPRLLGIAFCLLWAGSNAYARLAMRGNPEEMKGKAWAGILQAVAGLGLSILRFLPVGFLPAVLVVVLFTVSALTNRLNAVILDGAIGVGFAIFLSLREQPVLVEVVLLLDFLVVYTTILVGGMLAEWRKQQKMFDQARWAAAEFAHANVRLQTSMGETEKWTRDKERKRLAREIHDTVGYALTAILVQMSAAKELLTVDPSVIPSRIERLEDLLRKTIQEVRAEVSRLRKAERDSETWRTKWLELCKIFSDFTGVQIHAEVSEELEAVDDELGSIVYRIIQEGLTNAYRHGRASYIDVAMGWKGKERTILLRVSDNGLGANGISIGSGIKGIRERVEGLGGSVVWETLPHKGFDLGVTIPWTGSAA